MDLSSIMHQAREMQEKMAKVQNELASKTVTGSAGGGMVTAVATGDLRILEHLGNCITRGIERVIEEELPEAVEAQHLVGILDPPLPGDLLELAHVDDRVDRGVGPAHHDGAAGGNRGGPGRGRPVCRNQ